MGTLKKLPLRPWMKDNHLRKLQISCKRYLYLESTPTFYSEGEYMFGTFVWSEVNTGDGWVAYVHIDGDTAFNNRLRYYNAKELRPEEVRGLRAICETTLATAEQRNLLNDYETAVNVDQVSRIVRKKVKDGYNPFQKRIFNGHTIPLQ